MPQDKRITCRRQLKSKVDIVAIQMQQKNQGLNNKLNNVRDEPELAGFIATNIGTKQIVQQWDGKFDVNVQVRTFGSSSCFSNQTIAKWLLLSDINQIVKTWSQHIKISKRINNSSSLAQKEVDQSNSQYTQDDVKNINSSKSSSTRTQKSNSNRFTQENQNAVYEKYSSQKEFRRNSFENVSQSLKPCVRILNLLKNNKTSWPFRQPVDPIALGIPHYTEIIKEPMDLSTIENNLKTNQYITPTQFHADVAKIITNSYTFNALSPQFTQITRQFENYYQKIRSQQTSDIPRNQSQQQQTFTNLYNSKVASLQNKKAKKDSRQIDFSQSNNQVITMNQKKELGLNIKKLAKQHMKGILEIVNEGRQKNIVEFDLKQLNYTIIRKLQAYVKEKLSGQSKEKANLGDKPKQDEEESSFQVGEESYS